MPFIDADFLLKDTQPVERLLLTSADDSDVAYISFELARILAGQQKSVLWVDGNLGERSFKDYPDYPNLERVILGQLPLTEAIYQAENIHILSGKAEHFLAELSPARQYQFLQDLKEIYPNFDRVVLSVDGKNPALQQKWIEETENIYLLFNTKNLLLNRTLAWLEKNTFKTKGMIGIGKNNQEILLTYMRLKAILGQLPELILDIKKIAP